MIYPSHLQVETVNKVCDAKCIMCVIHENTRRRQVMSLDYFKKAIDRFLPYKEYFNFVTLHGCGEPLLDKTISEKVYYVKKMGFRGIGFASNCQALSEELSKKLLSAGLDTLLVSIDGFSKLVQERIRVGTNFDTIVGNVQKYISLRNTMNYSGRVLVRFIRQQARCISPLETAARCLIISMVLISDDVRFRHFYLLPLLLSRHSQKCCFN